MEFEQVHGLRMAYRSTGSGDPVVFLHGNPTSSYLWRGVLDRVAHHGRCLAPDLVGMGASDKVPTSGPDSYRFVEHRRYLDGLLDALRVDARVVLVGHDRGGVLAVDRARRHPDAVRGIAYLETLVAPVSWDGPDAPIPACSARCAARRVSGSCSPRTSSSRRSCPRERSVDPPPRR